MTTPLPPKNEKTPNLLPDITFETLPEPLRQAAGRFALLMPTADLLIAVVLRWCEARDRSCGQH
jgi:hypothetical protein